MERWNAIPFEWGLQGGKRHSIIQFTAFSIDFEIHGEGSA
ncbi:hypothetical protein HMPREF0239_01818 [Clostridium sp. ATCC BAA-442]|jgi:hypothetical protein|uniref:Uncharacterized protein n=1 Tax=Flavonifractor plautii ATCC 29863 TaxID=411475 RepID=G9YX73_FLAPL|nr:hypothetical protein HMPREF0372_04141 [Flavonifractor plautii ATCC 29863]ERI77156.1 hypothetical protein HMPREF0239_01818 [Clostridium sp. ATCC BAA-442]